MKNPTIPGWLTIGATALLSSLMALQHENLPRWAMVLIAGFIPPLTYIAYRLVPNDQTSK